MPSRYLVLTGLLVTTLILTGCGGAATPVPPLNTAYPAGSTQATPNAAYPGDIAPANNTALPVQAYPGLGNVPAPLDVKIIAKDTRFSPNTFTAQVGQQINLTLENQDSVAHDWLIDELNARTSRVEPGQTTTYTFVATTAGTYTYYCSVDGHRDAGMTGTLTVNP